MDKLIQVLLATISSKIEIIAQEALGETKKEVLDQKKKQFDNYGANDWDSEKFPDLQDSTVKRKKKFSDPDKPIYRTGALKNSLHISNDPESFDPETEVSYSKYQEGWLEKKGNQHSYIKLSEKEMEQAMENFVKNIDKGIKNAFN